MEARILKLALCATLSASLGASAALAASYRTQNFLVSAHSQRLAQEVAVAAERYRQRLAVDWLGQDLPPWTGSCPITVFAKPGLPAGGATSFGFHRGQPLGWTMQIQGSRERILDSVLPHEVLHTVFATHFGQPLPRWADEGACTTVEHRSEQTKQQDLLIRFLTTRPSRGIAFNQMFAMRDYPRDILPLYAQGYSVTKFLLARGGKRQFVEFVKTGLANQNWAGASSRYYEIRDLSDLQTTWLDWVRSGSPAPGFTRPAAGTDLVNPIPRDPFQADPTPSNGFPHGSPRASWKTASTARDRDVHGRLPQSVCGLPRGLVRSPRRSGQTPADPTIAATVENRRAGGQLIRASDHFPASARAVPGICCSDRYRPLHITGTAGQVTSAPSAIQSHHDFRHTGLLEPGNEGNQMVENRGRKTE